MIGVVDEVGDDVEDCEDEVVEDVDVFMLVPKLLEAIVTLLV
jgi:hypothetical protein